MDTGQWDILLDEEGYNARYVPTGHLVYGRARIVMAVPFDLDQLSLRGPPVQVLDAVGTRTAGAQLFAVSSRSLAYVPRRATQRQLVWVDREGVAQSVGAPLRQYQQPRLSPDGTTVAVVIESDIWIYDLPRGTLTALTRTESLSLYPSWSPDGSRVGLRVSET